MPQERVVLRHCGLIDPERIDSWLERGGFSGLQRAMSVTPEAVIDEIKASGLRGRGGAGFPVDVKWEGARKAPGNEKYVICNADEGEVGTFKDSYILENDPFTLIEGLAIAGYAVGADKGFIYLRAEYRHLLKRLQNAIDQAYRAGFLRGFQIELRVGAGAYVCGEESALMESLEGKRGESRFRPPFPTIAGLWQKPTTINNVETLMNVPSIMQRGAAWFSNMGTERSKGTKVFSVSGDVARPGVYELILGSPLKELVTDIAEARDVMMVQVGGATGRLLPQAKIDTPLAFETVLGAGAVTVFDNTRDVIDIVYRTMEFLAEESCGKCTPCRQGTEVMAEILERFQRGEGHRRDLSAFQQLSGAMALSSLCGLGQAAPFVVTDSLQYFPKSYEDRIRAGEHRK